MSGFGKKGAGPTGPAGGSFGKKLSQSSQVAMNPADRAAAEAHAIRSNSPEMANIASSTIYEQENVGPPVIWIRLLAIAIDLFIVGLISGVAVWGRAASTDWIILIYYMTAKGFFWLSVKIWLFQVLYHTVFETSGWQATIGKKAAGIIVTDTYGNVASFKSVLMRNFIGRTPTVWSFLYLTNISGIFMKDNQMLYDFLAGTSVRRRRAPTVVGYSVAETFA